MKFTKPPLSFADQVALLESRGMHIPDHGRASRYLSHINYYRLRAYWMPFEQQAGNPNHSFQPGASFDSALILYIFDRKFRLLVLEAIERVEVSLRTNFAYVLAMKYGSHAYLNQNIFAQPAFYQQLLSSLKEEIDRSQETFVEHYRNTYNDPALPPIWAISEVLTFGQLSKWFQIIKRRNDRKAIADAYGMDEKAFASFMHHLSHVRNFVAHHCRLWNRKLTVTMRIPKYPTKLVANCNQDPAAERQIYNTLVMLGYLLRLSSPGTTWPQRIRQLIGEQGDIDTAAMGFPADWKELPLWKGEV